MNPLLFLIHFGLSFEGELKGPRRKSQSKRNLATLKTAQPS